MKAQLHRIGMVLGTVVLLTGIGNAQAVYYFPEDGLTQLTSAGEISLPAGTLTVDTEGLDMVTLLVSGPDGLANCDLCDNGFLPDPGNPPFFVSTWTVGFINGSTQWIRTAPLQGTGYVGVVGQDPDPSGFFPDFGLTNLGPGLTEADFPGIFGPTEGGSAVTFATNGGDELFLDVTVVRVPEPSAIFLLVLGAIGLIRRK